MSLWGEHEKYENKVLCIFECRDSSRIDRFIDRVEPKKLSRTMMLLMIVRVIELLHGTDATILYHTFIRKSWSFLPRDTEVRIKDILVFGQFLAFSIIFDNFSKMLLLSFGTFRGIIL